MEAVAQMFEAEEGMRYEVEQKMKSLPYLWIQTLFPRIQGKYRPYCEVPFRFGFTLQDQLPLVQNLKTYQSEQRESKHNIVYISSKEIIAYYDLQRIR